MRSRSYLYPFIILLLVVLYYYYLKVAQIVLLSCFRPLSNSILVKNGTFTRFQLVCDRPTDGPTFHAATINDGVAFKLHNNHELRLLVSIHEQNICLAVWDDRECDGMRRMWTQTVIAILKWHSINLTKSKCLHCPSLLFSLFLSYYMKRNFKY